MKILKLKQDQIEKIIQQAAKVIANGGLVIYPTETVYGAGVDATNQTAVDKLLAYKSRREGKPLSIVVTDQQMASDYVEINQQAKKIYQNFLPGPVTVISKNKNQVAEGVASEFNTLGIRIPDHDLIIKLVKKLGKAITATSANTSGKKRPYSINDILNNISDKQKKLIDLIIDAGTLAKNEPSTVIDTTLSTPVKVRTRAIDHQSKQKILTLISKSEQETIDIAGKICLQHWNDVCKNGLIIGLDGKLGAGKTIFSKGVAKFLQIQEKISSPTYTYINEYPYHRHHTKGMFYHLDMWKVDSAEQLALLKIQQLIKANNILVIEWWQQVQQFMPQFNSKAKTVEINIQEINQQTRQLNISQIQNQAVIKIYDQK